ncbi:MAG TPA: AsmA family protein [Steroidobacteraceae bacterium]|nr:AsmA family protein [Steroidobacteraceae bacterium]
MSSPAATSTQRDQRAQVWRVVLLVTLVLLLALALAWDWNWFRGPIERRVSAATGREFRIAGPLEVDLGRIVIVRAEDLSLANARWSLTPEMARADLLRVEVPFWPLLRGERTLRRVDVVRPALLLERTRKGAANWQFRKAAKGAPAREPAAGWSFGELRVHDGRLDVRDAPLDTDLRLTVDSSTPQAGDESVRLLVRGSGRYRGHPFQLVGTADSPVALLERADAAYRVDFSARAGATRGRLHGALQVPLDPDRFTVNAELRGNDLGDLYPLVGLAVPSTPPYNVEGRLERRGRVVTLRDLRGKVGDSDVAGVVGVDLSGDKPLLNADLASTRLDLDDLGGFIGLPPSTAEGESASPEQRAEAARRAASPHLLPDKEYDLRKLSAINANFHLHADDIDAGKWPIQSLAMRLRLRDSLLEIEPVELGFAGGRIAGDVRLDARESRIDAGANLAVRSIDLEQVWPKMQPPNVGRINGHIDLRGQGNSVADMLATSDGAVQLGMGPGRFSNLLLELAGLDVAESLKFLLGKDKTVRLRCAYGDFIVESGKVDAQTLVFDTTDTVMFGDGTVNLEEEALALELRPEPKDFSPVSLRGPLKIGGTFKDPEFRPEAKSLLGRAAVAAALYAIAPPAALLALIETGPGEDIDCYTGKEVDQDRKRPSSQEADEARREEARREDRYKDPS